jgi:hypothetical protein
MRVYLPLTLDLLREAVHAHLVRPVGGTGFAVTEALRDEYHGADVEDLEYLAMSDAALASLRLIADSGAVPVRVVAAVDCDAGEHPVTERPDRDRAAVTLAGPVPWDAVAAVHLDGGDDAAVVRAAADAVTAADLGDQDAAITVGDAQDIDLAWYHPTEIGYLLSEVGDGGAGG